MVWGHTLSGQCAHSFVDKPYTDHTAGDGDDDSTTAAECSNFGLDDAASDAHIGRTRSDVRANSSQTSTGVGVHSDGELSDQFPSIGREEVTGQINEFDACMLKTKTVL